MLTSTEHLQRANAIGAETSFAIAALSVNSVERLVARHIGFAKTLLAEQAQTAKQPSARYAPGLDELSRLCQEQLQKMLDLSRDCMEITFATQGEMVRTLRDSIEGWTITSSTEHVTTATTVEASGTQNGDAATAKPKRKG